MKGPSESRMLAIHCPQRERMILLRTLWCPQVRSFLWPHILSRPFLSYLCYDISFLFASACPKHCQDFRGWMCRVYTSNGRKVLFFSGRAQRVAWESYYLLATVILLLNSKGNWEFRRIPRLSWGEQESTGLINESTLSKSNPDYSAYCFQTVLYATCSFRELFLSGYFRIWYSLLVFPFCSIAVLSGRS